MCITAHRAIISVDQILYSKLVYIRFDLCFYMWIVVVVGLLFVCRVLLLGTHTHTQRTRIVWMLGNLFARLLWWTKNALANDVHRLNHLYICRSLYFVLFLNKLWLSLWHSGGCNGNACAVLLLLLLFYEHSIYISVNDPIRKYCSIRLGDFMRATLSLSYAHEWSRGWGGDARDMQVNNRKTSHIHTEMLDIAIAIAIANANDSGTIKLCNVNN